MKLASNQVTLNNVAYINHRDQSILIRQVQTRSIKGIVDQRL